MAAFDAITHSVITNSLGAFCDETAEVLLRTSRSRTLSVGHDFSVGFTDAGGHLVTGGAGVPCHLASIDMCVRRLVDATAAVKGDRQVYFTEVDDRVRTTTYDGTAAIGGSTAGPEIVEFDHTTLPIPPGFTARPDVYGNSLLTTDA